MKKKHGITNLPTCEWVLAPKGKRTTHTACGSWPARKYGEVYLCNVHTPQNRKWLDEMITNKKRKTENK